MSNPPSLAELTENLVPFSAQQVASSLIWCALDVNEKKELHNACSYLIDPASTAPAKIFLAERYGGSGIQRNGGGARCGFDGHYQVKGIGANPLVGKGSDQRRTNGALAAIHAIYEVLWSEVLAEALPYGAVRTRAVLLTDHYIPFECNKSLSRRALLIRDPVVRPAHFERAPYFRTNPEYVGQLTHDAQRIRSVIHKLPANLPTPQAGFSEKAYLDPQLYCIEGLCELASRQAWQMAFCRTRFLRLTTSPSNIAIDGRLMDFNGLSCLFPGNYRDDFGYRLRLTELMKEPAVLQQGLSDLCLYLGKYLFTPEFTLIARQQVKDSYQKNFQQAYYFSYLELLGIPTNILSLKEVPETLKQLVNSFTKLLDSRSGTFYCPQNDDKSGSPLQKLVVALIRGSHGKMVFHFGDLKNDAHFTEALTCFTEAICSLVKSGQTQGNDVTVILKKMEQHAQQRMQPRDCLNKTRMSQEITGLLDTHGDDIPSLRQAFSEIETRIKNFAREALGHLKPGRYVP
ncbi:MAG: MchC protein [Rouxiella aceris]|uniref:MchC protein n=1 Tax=Rouxiella aceris TaxID=2703884 RepID=UPI00285045E9|nr:MchC protein [Rouxiella aceris]MDR3431147.1 MchC protein [Rouxiella aceris]